MVKNKETILIIEDEKSIANYIASILESNGYSCIAAYSGDEGLHMLTSHCPDLVILDLGLPDIDGMNVLENTRRWSDVPIVVVSARSYERDKVEAIDAGADDYITKPFGASELLARIRLAIRHHSSLSIDPQAKIIREYKAKNLHIDYEKRIITVDGNPVHLTLNEYKIVSYLAKNSGKVVTYNSLIKEVWGPYTGDDNQILRVNMANIRRKLEKDTMQPEYIFTEMGVGYRMLESE